jgi:hypothetical protein
LLDHLKGTAISMPASGTVPKGADDLGVSEVAGRRITCA